MNDMTLRDYFAAKAMPEVMRDWREGRELDPDGGFEEDLSVMAYQCYRMADAMLKEKHK